MYTYPGVTDVYYYSLDFVTFQDVNRLLQMLQFRIPFHSELFTSINYLESPVPKTTFTLEWDETV